MNGANISHKHCCSRVHARDAQFRPIKVTQEQLERSRVSERVYFEAYSNCCVSASASRR